MKNLLLLIIIILGFAACESPETATGTMSGDTLQLDPNRNKAEIDTTMHRDTLPLGN